MLFGKHKKEKVENETTNNAVFGELEFIDCAWEGDSVSSLFGEEKTIDLSSRFRASSIIVTCEGNCGIAIVDNTYEMGHNRFKFVVETEPDYEFTDSEEYFLETK